MTVLSVLRTGSSLPALTALVKFGSVSPSTASPLNALMQKHLEQFLRQNQSRLINLRQINTNAVRLQLKTSPDTRHFRITPSKYTWTKFKDMFHFYMMLGLIPGLIGVFLINIYIGPPTLAEIPEGYEPKHWEYHRHPITQFMARYLITSMNESYERFLFYLNEEEERRRMRKLAWKVEDLMKERGDFYNYYGVTSISSRYMRRNMEENKYMYDHVGANIDVGPFNDR